MNMYPLPSNTNHTQPSRSTARSALMEVDAVADKLETIGFDVDAATLKNLASLVNTCFDVHDTMTQHLTYRMVAEHEKEAATSRAIHFALGIIMTLAAAVLGFLIGRSI